MRAPRTFQTVGGDLGPYILGDRLGVGGMGVVYEASCPQLGERVAIKFLHPDRSADERVRRKFAGEAIAGRLVNHPHVAAVLDGGETVDGEPFLVMERVHGEPLGGRISRDGPLTPIRAVAIMRQVLSALASIHDAGIVHADIKSDNLLVETQDDGSDSTKLIDFGLAAVQFANDHVGHDVTPANEEWLSGTPEYMAPEVIRGEPPSFSSDLYAVGIIFYELLTGSTPFGGGSPAEIVQRHLDDEVVPPSLRCTDCELPSSLDYVILRALRKDPHQRYESARAFAAALPAVERDLGHRPWTRRDLTSARTLDWKRNESPTLGGGARQRMPAGTPAPAVPRAVHDLPSSPLSPRARRVGRR